MALAAATLVSEGKLYISELDRVLRAVTRDATLLDLLAHRTGLTGAFHLAWQGDGTHLIGKRDYLTCFNHLKPVTSFRERWIYNSWGYSVVGHIIERVSGLQIGEYLQKAVFNPLQLTRTTSQTDHENMDNLAEAYSTLSDGTPHLLPARQDFRDSLFDAAAGVYSSLNDMLKYSKHVLSSCIDLDSTSGVPGEELCLPEAATMYTQHIPIHSPAFRGRSYALGWIRTQLPGKTGLMGDNIRLLNK